MNQDQFVAELGKLKPGATFLTLKGYRNEHSEVADYSVVFHISYKSALERSIAALEPYVPADDLETVARKELIESYTKSLAKMEETPIEAVEDAYTHFTDENGKYIKGVKMHTESATLHLYGLVSQKKVLMPGNYPTKNKKPLTVAKDKLRKLCPVDKFRQFKITPEQVDQISVQNLSLLPPI